MQTCTNCGVSYDAWRGNAGQGYTAELGRYCCRECAAGVWCACAEGAGAPPAKNALLEEPHVRLDDDM